MELIKYVKESLIKQSRLVIPEDGIKPYRNYISDYLLWRKTTEGWLFWAILSSSYNYLGRYDYISIYEIYHRFGKDVFRNIYESKVNDLYAKCDRYDITLDRKQKEKLFEYIKQSIIVNGD